MSVVMCACQGIDHGRGCQYFGLAQGFVNRQNNCVDQEAAVVESRPQVNCEPGTLRAYEEARIKEAQESVAGQFVHTRPLLKSPLRGDEWPGESATRRGPDELQPIYVMRGTGGLLLAGGLTHDTRGIWLSMNNRHWLTPGEARKIAQRLNERADEVESLWLKEAEKKVV